MARTKKVKVATKKVGGVKKVCTKVRGNNIGKVRYTTETRCPKKYRVQKEQKEGGIKRPADVRVRQCENFEKGTVKTRTRARCKKGERTIN